MTYSNKAFQNQIARVYPPNDIGGFDHAVRVSQYATNMSEFYVAMCHDLVEDGYATVDDLRDWGLTDELISAIVILSRKKDKQTYAEYIQSIIDARDRALIGADLAFIVKHYDIYDHLHPHRGRYISHKKFVRSHAQRYLKALTKLVEARVPEE